MIVRLFQLNGQNWHSSPSETAVLKRLWVPISKIWDGFLISPILADLCYIEACQIITEWANSYSNFQCPSVSVFVPSSSMLFRTKKRSSVILFEFTRVGHRVGMSVCVFVCVHHRVQFFFGPLIIGPQITWPDPGL